MVGIQLTLAIIAICFSVLYVTSIKEQRAYHKQILDYLYQNLKK